MHTSRLAAAAAFVLAVTLGSGVTDSSPALAKQACTKTMFGNCIKGGHRCAKAMYAKRGRDAAGKRWICKGSRSQPTWQRSRCAKALDRVLQLEREPGNQEINALLDALGDRCPAHYEVFKDYVINKGMTEQFEGRPCAELLQDGTNRYAIAYLRRDGYCTGKSGSSGGGAQRDTGRQGGGWATRRQQEEDQYYQDQQYYENRRRQQEDDQYYEDQRRRQEEDQYEDQRRQQEDDQYYEDQRRQQEQQDYEQQRYQDQYYDQGN